MQRALLLLPLMASAFPCTRAQEVLFSEDFEGAQPSFMLNTADVSSVTSGSNAWLINNAYTGGQGTIECMGFPLPFSVPNTPAQPAGINTPNGKYMHIASMGGVASGVLNCHFAAADGFCTPAENFFARMTTDVNTMGASEVTLKFWWLCAGSNNNYGEVYYSTNGGSSWTLIDQPISQYRNQGTWTQQSISLPQFNGQNTLRFGFRFVNGSSISASDPGFAVDDVLVTKAGQEPNVILTGSIQPTSHCPGSTVPIPYTVTGSWGAGNVFTAQLSDATGNFDQPVDIGSIASQYSGSITATIPPATPLGTGYLVRVIGSDPSTMGTVSVTALTIVSAPYAGESTHITLCRDMEPQVLLDYLPGADACGDWSLAGSVVPGIIDPATASPGAYLYTTNCAGNCPQDQAVLTVSFVSAPDAGLDAQTSVCANGPAVDLFALLGGTPDAGGSWFMEGAPAGAVFNPTGPADICFMYLVAGIPPCATDTALVCVQVEDCTGVPEEAADGGLRWLGQSGMQHVLLAGRIQPDAVEVMDATGRRVGADLHRQGDKLLLSMGGVPAGMYFVRALRQGRTAVVRLVHQR